MDKQNLFTKPAEMDTTHKLYGQNVKTIMRQLL